MKHTMELSFWNQNLKEFQQLLQLKNSQIYKVFISTSIFLKIVENLCLNYILMIFNLKQILI